MEASQDCSSVLPKFSKEWSVYVCIEVLFIYLVTSVEIKTGIIYLFWQFRMSLSETHLVDRSFAVANSCRGCGSPVMWIIVYTLGVCLKQN